MKPIFYTKPVLYPNPGKNMDRDMRQNLDLICRRASELLQAAALIDRSEPGLLTQEERNSARRRGHNSAKRCLCGNMIAGSPHIAYFRSLNGTGFFPSVDDVSAFAQRVWILEDRCGLADQYLRGAADAAIQKGAEVILCPSPTRRDRLEAMFLPSSGAAFISDRAAESMACTDARRVHLDRIPNAEHKRALRGAMRENRNMIQTLIARAAMYLANARILCELGAIPCADEAERL